MIDKSEDLITLRRSLKTTPNRGLTLGYKGDFAGVNSEWIRHVFQNRFAHDMVNPQPGFLMLDQSWKPYFASFPLSSTYSLW